MSAGEIIDRVSGPFLVIGLGCERETSSAEVIALVEDALAVLGAARGDVACVASIDAKADDVAIKAAARHFAVPSRFFDAATLEAETPRLQNPSEVVFAHVGCHGVAEAAALAGAGCDAALVVAKIRSAHATVAIARAVTGRLGGSAKR